MPSSIARKSSHTDTWVYKNSKHEFCVFASKHALWWKLSLMMKIYTNWAFLRPANTSLHGDFTIENPSFSMYLLSTQEHTIPLCVKILQILFWLELSWLWIEGNGRFWDFLTFYVPLCSKKLSVHRHPKEKEFLKSTEGFLRVALTVPGHHGPVWKIARMALFDPCMEFENFLG